MSGQCTARTNAECRVDSVSRGRGAGGPSLLSSLQRLIQNELIFRLLLKVTVDWPRECNSIQFMQRIPSQGFATKKQSVEIYGSIFFSDTQLTMLLLPLAKRGQNKKKKCDTFSICACHPCAGAMLIFSVSFQFLRMTGFDPGSTALAAAMATEVDPPLALNTHLFGAGLRAKEKCVCCAQIL